MACVPLVGAPVTASDPQTSSLLTLPLTGPEAWLHEALTPGALVVRLDGQPQRVVRILETASAGAPGAPPTPWRVVIYVDTPLTTPDGLRRSATLLEREAATLAGLGPTEIILADPAPRALLGPTQESIALKEALRDIRSEASSTGELLWHRQRFSAPAGDSDPSQLAVALRTEVDLIERQRQHLLRWLAESDVAAPSLLILVQNGHDLNPRAYYSEQTADSFLEDPRSRSSQAALSKVIAARGWTVLCLSLGTRPEEFTDPSAPLFDLARATGGAVVTSRKAATRNLRQISSWPILLVELAVPADSGVLPLQVLRLDSEESFKSRQWASVGPLPLPDDFATRPDSAEDQGTPVLQLLRPAGLTLTGEVRIRTITGLQRIAEVAFLVDGQEVARTARAPFSAIIDLGAEVRPHMIDAIAYSRSGRRLGRDSLQVNVGLEPPRVVIDEVAYDENTGELRVAATVTAPAGVAPERVDFYLNDQKSVTLEQPPYRARFEARRLEPEDFVRVLAHYPGGETAEAAKLPAAAGQDDELEVNLVELLAMVTPRNRKTQMELGREDFVIRQHGRLLSIDQFSRWEESPLTLGLVLDTSDSMDAIIEDAREAGERFFAEALKTGDEAFVVDFDNLPRLARRVTGDSDRLLHSLEGLEASGMTALYDAIVFSLQQFENKTGRRALVVVTDGEDSASFYQPRECVRQARLHGVPVYLIVLGTPPDPSRQPELLRNLMVARRSGGEVYYISDLSDLSGVYDQIVGELRQQYFLAFNTSHTLSPKELEEIEVEVVPKGVDVRTLLASQQRGG